MKRPLSAGQTATPPDRANKRLKPTLDRLSSLSDELVLRVLHHLDIPSVVVCARLSKKFKALSYDSQLWKAAYHERFLAPRLRRISTRRSFATLPASSGRPVATTRSRGWLDEEKLVRVGNTTDWKRQYKLRSNWSNGTCNLAEIPLAAPPILSLLARLHAGVIVTADKDEGLRAWSYKGQTRLLGQYSLSNRHLADGTRPVALAVDADNTQCASTRIAVGFENGSFGIYTFDPASSEFRDIYFHPPSRHGALSGIAISSNHLLTMSSALTLSLYRLNETSTDAPLLLTSLKSHSGWPPLSLTLRSRPDKILVCIAYATPSMTSGWSTGIQELHVSFDGELLDSRLAHSDTAGTREPDGRTCLVDESPMQLFGEPTSLSYSHPYLLVSHADNTLTLYLVKSSDEGLSMSPGKRLWGHTSSVFGAQVGGRGKAVSVSSKGDEIRVWELEGATMTRGKGADSEGYSIQVRPERRPSTPARLEDLSAAIAERGEGLGLALQRVDRGESVTKCWVGFDEENVVVVREQDQARQALAVYDFT